MPVSQETAARADHPVNTPIYDKDAYVTDAQLDSAHIPVDDDSDHRDQYGSGLAGSGSGHPSMPSETVRPGVADDASQQGATQPGSGSAVPSSAAGAGAGAGGASTGTHQPSFKERVIGVAKKTRGATLGNTETKEQGQRILQGQEVFEPKKVGPGAKKERFGSF